MLEESRKFQTLFKRYKLKAEFSTLSELGMALAEKGFIYEDSMFSHWQKGDRLPSRATLLTLIEIFAERQSMRTLANANEFLESADQGYLTEKEASKIKFNSLEQIPFQVPNQIENFTGREALIKNLKKEIVPGSILLIHGTAGVGKSALAIRLGHLLRDKFSDGVLWHRLDTSDVMDVLLSIAFAFGRDIGHIQDKEIRASMVRSILTKKKVLLIFDNVELKNDLSLLLPNDKNCAVIITSRFTNLSIPNHHINISLETFTVQDTLLLFKTILGNQYVIKNKSKILQLANKVGSLPLALHIFAKELKKESLTIAELLEEIEEDTMSLEELSYGDKNLYIAINFSYELLDRKTKKVFLSLAVFNGKDFSIESVAFVNDVSLHETKRLLQNLRTVSLIEESTKTRYRMHPMIKKFVRTKFDNPSLFLKAAKYYEEFLAKYDKTVLKSYPNIKQESDNVLYIFQKCYELHYWNEVIALWNPLESLLHATNQQAKMRYLYQIVKTEKTGLNIYQKFLLAYGCFLFLYWVLLHFTGWKTSFWNHFYSFSLGLIPLIGGMIGLSIARSWGLFKSLIGKAIFFLSSGLFTWGVGNIVFAYYNFFQNISAPYPSLADFGYLPSYLLWTIGMINLPHAIGGKFAFRKKYRKTLFLIPLFVLSFSYSLVVFITKSTVVFAPVESYIKLFFDIAYPLSAAIILTTALIVGTSFKFFGGRFKLAIYCILLGFCFQYIADFLFSYTTTTDLYFTGNITDLFFSIAMAFLVFGVLGFHKNNPS